MAWHSGKPADTDLLSQSVQHIRENFTELEPLQPYVAAIVNSRIVEMGSNSNGSYVRWENGLQVCFSTRSTSASEDTLWTLPAAFIDNIWTFCGGVAANFGAGAQVITFQGRMTNSITLRVLDASGDRVAGTASIFAIGRWK